MEHTVLPNDTVYVTHHLDLVLCSKMGNGICFTMKVETQSHKTADHTLHLRTMGKQPCLLLS